MPAYNAGKYIAEAIHSVLDQDFQDFEMLMVDDGSADDTRQLVAAFDDERIRLLAQEKKAYRPHSTPVLPSPVVNISPGLTRMISVSPSVFPYKPHTWTRTPIMC